MHIRKIIELINDMLPHISFEERIEMINIIKAALSEYSPFRHHPVDCVEWVKMGSIKNNEYNPNTMSPPEIRTLHLSLLNHGFTQPLIVAGEKDNYEIVDGSHRFLLGTQTPALQQKNYGYFPVVKLDRAQACLPQRLVAMLRTNRARGRPGVAEMVNIVVKLSESGWSLNKISDETGMAPDEVLRLKQLSGLTTLFEQEEFSEAWTVI